MTHNIACWNLSWAPYIFNCVNLCNAIKQYNKASRNISPSGPTLASFEQYIYISCLTSFSCVIVGILQVMQLTWNVLLPTWGHYESQDFCNCLQKQTTHSVMTTGYMNKTANTTVCFIQVSIEQYPILYDHMFRSTHQIHCFIIMQL